MFNRHEVNWNTKAISNLWSFYSRNEYYRERYFAKKKGKYLVRLVRKYLRVGGISILDYGSGPGYLFDAFKDANIRFRYFAVDYSEDAIEELKRRIAGHPCFGGAYPSDLVSALRSERFDLICSCEVIEHLDDEAIDGMFSNLELLASENTYICLTTPNNEDLDACKTICPECGCTFHMWQHVRSWDREGLCDFMEKKGFRAILAKEVFLAPLPRRIWHGVKRIPGEGVKKPNLVYIGKK